LYHLQGYSTTVAPSETETVQSTSYFSSPETTAASLSSSSSSVWLVYTHRDLRPKFGVVAIVTPIAQIVKLTRVQQSSSVSSIRQMTTVAGTVKTIYLDPTGTPGTTSGDSGDTKTKSSGLGTGPVVGIVIGVIGAVLIVAGGALFWFFRKKREQRQVEGYQDDPSFRGSSGSNGPDNGSGGVPASPNSAGNRSSMLQIDPRMDPFKQGLYPRAGSHESINTLRDDHDYSRRIQQPKVLRATNPDPDNED
jgi:hypothetical protein